MQRLNASINVPTPVTNVFVQSIQLHNQSTTMTASELLAERDNVPLKKLVIELMLELGRNNEAWYKFAQYKGAIGTEASERELYAARSMKEPEQRVIPQIAELPGYSALQFLDDLLAIKVDAVSKCAQAILLHFAEQHNIARTKAERAARLNSDIRQWIVSTELTTDSLSLERQLKALKMHQISSMTDLKKMTQHDFEICGFSGLHALKAYESAQKK